MKYKVGDILESYKGAACFYRIREIGKDEVHLDIKPKNYPDSRWSSSSFSWKFSEIESFIKIPPIMQELYGDFDEIV